MEHDTLRPEEAPPRRRLTRSRNDRVVAGVAGGLGRYFDLDPVIFRIAFAALAVAGGSGVLLYVVAWLAVPEHGREASIGEGYLERTSNGRTIGLVLLAIAAVMIGGRLFDGGFGAAFVLMAAGVALLLWKRNDGRPEDDDRDGFEDVDVDGFGGLGDVGGFDDVSGFDDAGESQSSGFVVYRRERRPRAPRSYLGRLTFAALLLMAGVFAAGHASNAFDVSVGTFLATALLITGLALVASARFGRARALIPVGIVLVALTAAAASIDVPLRGGLGDRVYQPATRAELRDEYRLLAGQMVLDLTRVPFGEGTTTIAASVAAGELRVILPRRLDVEINAEAGAGQLEVLGSVDDGIGVDVTRRDDTPGSATLELDLEVGAGHVEVDRAAA